MVKQYLDHSLEILTSDRSNFKGGSKGAGIISKFGHQSVHNLSEGYPLLTTKQMAFKSMLTETLWFMKGDTNIKYLEERKCPVWRLDAFQHNYPGMVQEGVFPADLKKYSSDWQQAVKNYGAMVKEDKDGFAEQFGDAGPIYGKQWRKWKYFDEDKKEFVEIDQLQNMIEGLKKKPTGKKHIVTAWEPGDVPSMSLPPCHVMFQATGNEHGELELQLYQRSCDQFLGVPFNLSSYALLTHVIAKEAGMTPKTFVHTFGDSHFYASIGERTKKHKEMFPETQERIRQAALLEEKLGDKSGYLGVVNWINDTFPSDGNMENYDHVTAILEQLSREPREKPTLEIADKPLDELDIEDFVVKDYDPHPPIRRKMAV
jgi:thymidylate synthase